MENPDKPVVIPPRQDSKRKKERGGPDFVRNVMGSSAGAGSGEFHVYRHLRRKEFARQRMIEEEARREELDSEYQARLERNRKEAEERVERNRLKRLKKKQKMRRKNKRQKTEDEDEDPESSDGQDGDSDGQKKETDTDGQREETDTDGQRKEAEAGVPGQQETEATKD